MATINLDWKKFKAPVGAAKGWRQMKEWLGELADQLPDRSVYVIRTARPFSIAYSKKASPVLYIGEGDFERRFRDHMQKWIVGLSEHLPQLEIEVRYCRAVVRGRIDVHKDVEADLIWRFSETHGSVPMFNRQHEYHEYTHTYGRDFYSVLSPGKGRGYQWALTPLSANLNYPRFLKGRFE